MVTFQWNICNTFHISQGQLLACLLLIKIQIFYQYFIFGIDSLYYILQYTLIYPVEIWQKALLEYIQLLPIK